MKKTLSVLALALLMVGNVIAQKSNIPSVVKTKFAEKYPAVKKVKWEKEGKEYEAGFTLDGKEVSVAMDGKGNILETETEITVSALPKAVQDYLSKNLKGKKVTEAAEIIDAKGQKTYEAEVGGKDLIFDANGVLVKK